MLNNKPMKSFFSITEEQMKLSVSGANIETDTSRAIAMADDMAESSGNNMTVIRSKDQKLCVFSGFQLTVKKDLIAECIYSTDHGFNYALNDVKAA